MGIPKIIHYCWFGGNEFSDLMKACIDSWKKYCPDYQIIEWNESNSDFSECAYAVEAYKNKSFAFVSDYMRNKVVYEHGGIYLDTDVMLVKSLDPLLEHDAFIGWEEESLNTGLGFGAAKHNPIVKEFMDDYLNMDFWTENGEINPIIEPVVVTEILMKHGMEFRDDIIQKVDSFTVYPREYFCPLDIRINKMKKTKNTYSIHYYTASWYNEEQKKERVRLTKRRRMEKLLGKRLFFVYSLFFEGGIKDFMNNRKK